MSAFAFRGWSKGAASRIYVESDGRTLGHIDLVTGDLHPTSGHAEQLRAAAGTLVERLDARRHIPGDLALRPPAFMLKQLLSRTHTPDRRARVQAGIEGEERTARVLARLAGVRPLHSLPLSPDHDVDHIVCGSPGVVVLNTKTTVFDCTVDDGVIRVGGHRQDWLPKARNDADALESMLRRSGVSVPVNCLLVVWAKTFTGSSPIVIPGTGLGTALSELNTDVSPAVVDVAYEVMRHPDFWA